MTRLTVHRRLPSQIILAVLMLLAALDAAAAQRRPVAPPARTGWLPAYETGGIGGDLTDLQRNAAMAVLQKIEQILLRMPEVASPKGYTLMPQFLGGTRMLGLNQEDLTGSVVEYAYHVWFLDPSGEIANGASPCINATVNFTDLWALMDKQRGHLSDAQGRYLYVEPQRTRPIPLTTQVYGEAGEGNLATVILTSGGEPYWKTVTREEYYNALILEFEGKDGEKIAAAREALEKTPYQQWMEGAAKRKQDMEATLKALAQTQPAADVAAMRKTFEQTERDVTEQMRANDPTDREVNSEERAKRANPGDPLHAELRSMTPAQRRQPAVINPTGPGGVNGHTMADRDALSMWRVLTPNLDFWRARRSPVEVRSIALNFGNGPGCTEQVVVDAVSKIFAKVDWAALNQLLDVPR